jgi:hypothetical protein
MEYMEKIRAKSIVKNRFWILQQNNIKIGEIREAAGDNLEVIINGKTAGQFESVAEMKESALFEFIEIPKSTSAPQDTVHGYPSDGPAFNAVWNIQYKLPVYTRTEDSKSWTAAGYYKVEFNGVCVVQFCPKMLTLQRNKYTGPFKENPAHVQFNRIFE